MIKRDDQLPLADRNRATFIERAEPLWSSIGVLPPKRSSLGTEGDWGEIHGHNLLPKGRFSPSARELAR